jgi:hypothetical protein
VLLVAVPLFLTAETAEDAELFQCFEIFSALSVCSAVRLGQQHSRGTLSNYLDSVMGLRDNQIVPRRSLPYPLITKL